MSQPGPWRGRGPPYPLMPNAMNAPPRNPHNMQFPQFQQHAVPGFGEYQLEASNLHRYVMLNLHKRGCPSRVIQDVDCILKRYLGGQISLMQLKNNLQLLLDRPLLNELFPMFSNGGYEGPHSITPGPPMVRHTHPYVVENPNLRRGNSTQTTESVTLNAESFVNQTASYPQKQMPTHAPTMPLQAFQHRMHHMNRPVARFHLDGQTSKKRRADQIGPQNYIQAPTYKLQKEDTEPHRRLVDVSGNYEWHGTPEEFQQFNPRMQHIIGRPMMPNILQHESALHLNSKDMILRVPVQNNVGATIANAPSNYEMMRPRLDPTVFKNYDTTNTIEKKSNKSFKPLDQNFYETGKLNLGVSRPTLSGISIDTNESVPSKFSIDRQSESYEVQAVLKKLQLIASSRNVGLLYSFKSKNQMTESTLARLPEMSEQELIVNGLNTLLSPSLVEKHVVTSFPHLFYSVSKALSTTPTFEKVHFSPFVVTLLTQVAFQRLILILQVLVNSVRHKHIGTKSSKNGATQDDNRLTHESNPEVCGSGKSVPMSISPSYSSLNDLQFGCHSEFRRIDNYPPSSSTTKQEPQQNPSAVITMDDIFRGLVLGQLPWSPRYHTNKLRSILEKFRFNSQHLECEESEALDI